MINFSPIACSLCKLDTAALTIFSDIVIVWIIAILLFTHLSNVGIFIRRVEIVFRLAGASILKLRRYLTNLKRRKTTSLQHSAEEFVTTQDCFIGRECEDALYRLDEGRLARSCPTSKFVLLISRSTILQLSSNGGTELINQSLSSKIEGRIWHAIHVCCGKRVISGRVLLIHRPMIHAWLGLLRRVMN